MAKMVKRSAAMICVVMILSSMLVLPAQAGDSKSVKVNHTVVTVSVYAKKGQTIYIRNFSGYYVALSREFAGNMPIFPTTTIMNPGSLWSFRCTKTGNCRFAFQATNGIRGGNPTVTVSVR